MENEETTQRTEEIDQEQAASMGTTVSATIPRHGPEQHRSERASAASALSSPDLIRRRADAVVLASMAHGRGIPPPATTEERSPSSDSHPARDRHRRSDPQSPVIGSSGKKKKKKKDRSPDLPPSPLVTPPGGKSVSHNGEEPHQEPPYSNLDDQHRLGKPASAAPDYSSMSKAESEAAAAAAAKRGVPHIYHDYSQVPDVVGYVRKKTGGVTQPFPEKLHEMLQTLEDHDPVANQLVSWLPHGRAFLVHKPKEFTREIMPKYFRQTKLTSFQRQLNLYGFRRITQGPDAGAYYHEMFLRGRKGLCQRMVRQKVKGTGHKQPADASSEPNFYQMPPLDQPSPTASKPPPPLSPPQLTVLSPAANTAKTGSPSSTASADKKYPTHGFVLNDAHSSSAGASSAAMYSPGMQSVHGAAHLLQGIASGMTTLPPPQFLGPSAASRETSSSFDSSSRVEQQQQGPAASFLPEEESQGQTEEV